MAKTAHLPKKSVDTDAGEINSRNTAWPSPQYATGGLSKREYAALTIYANMLGNYVELPADPSPDAAYAVNAANILFAHLND